MDRWLERQIETRECHALLIMGFISSVKEAMRGVRVEE